MELGDWLRTYYNFEAMLQLQWTRKIAMPASLIELLHALGIFPIALGAAFILCLVVTVIWLSFYGYAARKRVFSLEADLLLQAERSEQREKEILALQLRVRDLAESVEDKESKLRVLKEDLVRTKEELARNQQHLQNIQGQLHVQEVRMTSIRNRSEEVERVLSGAGSVLHDLRTSMVDSIGHLQVLEDLINKNDQLTRFAQTTETDKPEQNGELSNTASSEFKVA